MAGQMVGVLTHSDMIRMMHGWAAHLICSKNREEIIAFTRIALSVLPALPAHHKKTLLIQLHLVRGPFVAAQPQPEAQIVITDANQ